jgi:hypothetical protein
MIRKWSARLGSIALGLLILGGGSGLPVLDAVLHHWRAGPAAAQTQLLDPDSNSSHAARCTLGTALPALVAPVGSASAAVVTLAPERCTAERPVTRIASLQPSTSALPRAPPVTPV